MVEKTVIIHGDLVEKWHSCCPYHKEIAQVAEEYVQLKKELQNVY